MAELFRGRRVAVKEEERGFVVFEGCVVDADEAVRGFKEEGRHVWG